MIAMFLISVLGFATPIFTAVAADAPASKNTPAAKERSGGSSADSRQEARTKPAEPGRLQIPLGGPQYPYDKPE